MIHKRFAIAAGRFFDGGAHMPALDVTVTLYKDGVPVIGRKSSGDDSARLGRAVIGRMRLGKG